jgi:hypothetical protein
MCCCDSPLTDRAGYPERQREGAKFIVAPRPQRTAPRGVVPVTPEEQAAEQLQRQRLGLAQDGGAGGAGDGAAAGGGEAWLEAAMVEGGGLEGLLDSMAGCAVAGGCGSAAVTGETCVHPAAVGPL